MNFKTPRAIHARVYGNPEQFVSTRGLHPQMRVITDAIWFFDTHPARRFLPLVVDHDQLKRLANSGPALTGSIEHPRSHRYNTARDATFDGPGPHGLIFYRDWHQGSEADDLRKLRPEARPRPEDALRYPRAKPLAALRHPRVKPGVLVLPNMPTSGLFNLDDAAQEDACGKIWACWEAHTGHTALPAGDAVRALLRAIPLPSGQVAP